MKRRGDRMKRRWVRASDQPPDESTEDFGYQVHGMKMPPDEQPGAHREDNRIDFYSEVTPTSARELISHLRAACLEMRQVSLVFGMAEPPPVHLHIHSEGGDLFAGMAVMDAIRELKKHGPIHTHIEGQAASAATLISCAGTRRTIGANAFMLIHQLSAGFVGKYEDMKDEMANNDMLMAKIIAIYAQHSKMSAEQLEAALKNEIWFNAEKALELGLVDEIR